MSTWTHVTGAIYLDDIISIVGQRDNTQAIENICNILGKPCHWQDDEADWDSCPVPMGSEGSLDYKVSLSKSDSRFGVIAIWGDLRDYDSLDGIKEWLIRISKELEKSGFFIRQMGIEAEVECGEHIVVTWVNADEGIKITPVK